MDVDLQTANTGEIRVEMKKFCKLPDQMVVHILCWLPPKSLTRFKCIGKSWYNLFIHPRFVSKHLSNSTKNRFSSTCVLFSRSVLSDVDTDEKGVVFSLVTFLNDGEEELHFIVEHLSIPPSVRVDTTIDVIGHCDGINCLTDKENNIMLWNPAIKQYKFLPKSCISLHLNYLTTNIIGFGYDPQSECYKVVNIVTSCDDAYTPYPTPFPPRAEVYKLGSHSWRDILIDHLESETTSFCPKIFQMCFKGNCYWIGHEHPKEPRPGCGSDDGVNNEAIIVFDMRDEEFHYILLPDSLYESSVRCYDDLSLIQWNESIALSGLYYVGPNPECIALWAMDDSSGVNSSWTKQLSIEPIVIAARVLKFWKSDEILMAAHDGIVFSYNLGTDSANYLPIDSIHPSDFRVFICVNSIVPLLEDELDD